MKSAEDRYLEILNKIKNGCLDVVATSSSTDMKTITELALKIMIHEDSRIDRQNEFEFKKRKEARLTEHVVTGNPYCDNILYIIRCRTTGRKYIGKSVKSFIDRYRRGWWFDHHNENLMRDVRTYGPSDFTIEIISADDTFSLGKLEKEMIRRSDPDFLYNMTL